MSRKRIEPTEKHYAKARRIANRARTNGSATIVKDVARLVAIADRVAIADKLITLLRSQGDLKGVDFVEGETTVSDLLNAYA